MAGQLFIIPQKKKKEGRINERNWQSEKKKKRAEGKKSRRRGKKKRRKIERKKKLEREGIKIKN